tara:strand:- start:815 stop:1240 length:426 start_codon:yes stop_codon:yes gene_type:complete
MSWIQKEILISSKKRGFHLITADICNQIIEIKDYQIGLVHLFIKHTSASLGINENADYTVRLDMESHFNQMVPEDASYYTHTLEGSDDMPAHLKSILIGSSVSIPIRKGYLGLGRWQGVYMCEHRNSGGDRKIIATINGVK